MTRKNRWLLPEGIEELLPAQARQLEQLRRELLDLYSGWGYELIIPPFIEYLDSLLTGTGHDLDLQTFKLIDQLSGRLLGLRADMTPQAARIDAHRLQREAPTRLCYLGTVLHTLPDGFAGSRSLMQVGAELFGHSGPESDVEILALLVATLALLLANLLPGTAVPGTVASAAALNWLGRNWAAWGVLLLLAAGAQWIAHSGIPGAERLLEQPPQYLAGF